MSFEGVTLAVQLTAPRDQKVEMEKRLARSHFTVEELVNALMEELERRGVISLEDVLRVAEASRRLRDEETAAVFMGQMHDEAVAAAEETPKVEAPPKPAADNRTNRRLEVKRPIRVRAHFPEFEFTDITETVDVSRNGLYFVSDKPYQLHRDVRVVVPYDPKYDAQSIESSATVVRIVHQPGQPKRGIALRMSHLFFK